MRGWSWVEDPKQLHGILTSERRDHARYSVDEDCVLMFIGNDQLVPCSVVDLSQEGCRVRVRQKVAARSGWPVDVSFRVSGLEFHLSGMVQWANSHDLLGIRFVNIIPRRMLDLAEVLCAIEAAAAARVEGFGKAEPPRRDTARSLPSELPVPRPAPGPGGNGASPAQGAKPEVGTGKSAIPRRERRSSERHEVDNFATIYLVNVGSTLRGRIVDLSPSGCRIQTEERFPVGIYTRVETEFHLEGLPFRLGGVVQAIHDRHAVGIRFLDLSERKRQQVTELIAEINEMREALPVGETRSQDHI